MPEPRTENLKRFTSLLRPYAGRFWLATGMLILGSLVNLAIPQTVRLAVDEAIAKQDSGTLQTIMLVALAGFAFLGVLVFLRHYLMSWLGSRVVADLRVSVFRRLLLHPPGFFHERSSGELVSRLTSDIEMISHAVGAELSMFLRSSITAVGGLLVLFVTTPGLSVIMVLIVPPLAVMAVLVGRSIRKRARQVQDELAQANRGLKEAVVGIDTVQAFNAEESTARSYTERVFDAFRAYMAMTVARGGFMGAMSFAAYGATAVILWLGAEAVIDGDLKPGELSSFLLYTVLIAGALGSIAQVWANLQSALGATGRIFELLDEEPGIRDAPNARDLPDAKGRIEFEEVSFHYPTRPDVRVLDEVGFRVEPGEMVALVGHSGAGKSTIINLLMRFYDPVEGTVRVDGHDVRGLKLEALRGLMAPVSQEPMLFSGTIGENIAFARPEAPLEAIRRAARDAAIAEFIEALPDGYDTPVGERGVKLSGGQRQRVAIARAVLADPRILILDEATSHLDSDNEALIQEALERLMVGRTTIVIAHRLATVQNADRILVVSDGRIAETGTHVDLMNRDTLYRRLTEQQALTARPGA